MPPRTRKLTFAPSTPTGVVPLILDPSNTDCVFQVNSIA